MFEKILISIGLASVGLLLVLLNVTTPSTSGAAMVLLVFLLGYASLVVGVTFLLWGIDRVLGKVRGELHRPERKQKLSVRKAYYYASVIALAPVIITSLQSVGGVGGYEVFLVGLFVVLGCVYIARRTS